MASLVDDPLYIQMVAWRVNGLESILAEVETVDPSCSNTRSTDQAAFR